MAGLSDDEVFGAAPAPGNALSDADVFGGAPSAPASKAMLSDADVFAPSSPSSPGVLGYAGELGKSFLKGGVEAAITSPMRGYAGQHGPEALTAPAEMQIALEGLLAGKDIPEAVNTAVQTAKPIPVTQHPLYQAAESISGALPTDSDIFPKFGGKDVIRDVAGGLGSVAGNIGQMMIPGVNLLGIPNVVAQGAGEATERAVKAQATPEQIQRAARFGNISGATEFADALLVNLGSWGKVAGLMKQVGVNALKGALIEGGQEGLQQFIQNVIAKGIYKPDQSLGEDVAYNAVIGGIVGGGVGGVMTHGEAPVTPPSQETLSQATTPPVMPSPVMPEPGQAPITSPAPVPQDTVPLPPLDGGPVQVQPPVAAPGVPLPSTDQTTIRDEITRLQGLRDRYEAESEAAREAQDYQAFGTAQAGLKYVLPQIANLEGMLPTPTMEETKARTLSPQIVDFVSKEAGLKVPSDSTQLSFDTLISPQSEPQMSQVQAAPGANTARLAKLLGPKLYGDPANLVPVSVKEMFQNAFDAVKSVLERRGLTEGKIDITMDRASRSISVTDNGSGMTPEVLANQFLQIAGTHKESKRASGGLGIAKMLFIFGNKGLHVTTMRNGKVAELNTTGEELFTALDDVKKAPQINVRSPTAQDLARFPSGSGTHIEVTVPEHYMDSTTGESREIKFVDYSFQHRVLQHSPLFDNIEVSFNGEPLEMGKNFPIKDFTQFANVNFDWGTARVYVSQKPTDDKYSKNLHVLSNGLWQFSGEIKKDPLQPYGENVQRQIYVDVNPRALPEEPGYPFDLNRQGFSPSTKKAFENLFKYIGLLYRQVDAQRSVANFGSMQFLDYDAPNKGVKASQTVKIEPKAPPPPNAATMIKPGDKVSVVDGQLVVNGRQVPELTPEEIEKFKINPDSLRVPQSEIDPRRVILHDNTDVEVSALETRSITEYGRERFGQRFDQYAFALGNAFKELRDVVVRYMPKIGHKGPITEGQTTPQTNAQKLENLLEQTPFGVRDDNGYEQLKTEGIGVSFDKQYYGVSITVPFRAMFLNVAIADRTDPLGAAVDMTYTMIHELAHHVIRNHDAEFMNEMQRIMVMLETNPNFNFHAFKQKMVNILSAYHDVYSHLRGVYTSGDFKITNRGQRFEDANASKALSPALNSVQNAGTDEVGNGDNARNDGTPRDQPESGAQLSDWSAASATIPPGQSGRADPTLAIGPSRSHRPSDNGRARNYAALRDIDPGISAPPQQPEINVLRSAIMNSPVGPLTPELKEAASHADRYNWKYKFLAGITQLLDGNPYFQPLRKYVERVRAMHSDESKIHDAALRLMKDWRALGSQMANLEALILDVQDMPYLSPAERRLQAWRHPSPAEFDALVKKHKVSDEALKVYNKMRQMDETFLRLLEFEAKESARRRIPDPVKLAARFDEIEATGRIARNQPFFPFTRFGRYYVTVKDAAGKVLHFETFEPRRFVGITTKRAEKYQMARKRELEKKVPPGAVVETGVLPETAEPLVGLPVLLLQELLGENVSFTKDQIEAIKLMQSSRNPAMALKQRAIHGDRSVTGVSLDLPRSFAKYFFHGGRYYAKVKHSWALRGHIAEAQIAPGNKAGLIASYMNDHLTNTVLDAKGDFGFAKGAIFLWAMGYSVAAATTNLTQTPFVSFPFLAGKFGDFSASKHLVKSMLDITNFYKRGAYVEPSPTTSLDFELKALGYGVKTGRISETQAPELAGMAGGGKLISGMGGHSALERGAARFQEKAAWAFEMAEQFNRRIVYRAALRLAQEQPNTKFVKESVQKYQGEYKQLVAEFGSEAKAASVVTAIHATDQTQFVYARYARSRLFRGPRNILFVFKQYIQSLLWMLGQNKADVLPRWLIITMLMGGLGGIPGYDDLKGIIRAIGAWYFNKDVNLDKMIRDWALQWFNGTIAPDLVLHGLSRRGFGIPAMMDMAGSTFTGQPGRSFWDPKNPHSTNVPYPVLDRSRAIGVGNILPLDIGKMFTPTDKLDKTISEETQRASGAVFSVGFNIYKAIMDQDSPASDYKRWEKAMPRALSSVSRSYRVFNEGRERGGKGGPNSASTIVPYDVRDTEQMMEALAMGLGYQPLRQQAKWDLIMAQAESSAFYDLKKKGLLEEWFEAMKGGDPKEVEAVREAVLKYNKELPDYAKAMSISGDTIRKSMQTRERTVISREMGIPVQKSKIGISQEMQRLFPEATVDVRRVR